LRRESEIVLQFFFNQLYEQLQCGQFANSTGSASPLLLRVHTDAEVIICFAGVFRRLTADPPFFCGVRRLVQDKDSWADDCKASKKVAEKCAEIAARPHMHISAEKAMGTEDSCCRAAI